LSAALRGGDEPERSGEFADVLAWLATLANIAGIDMEAAYAINTAAVAPGAVHHPVPVSDDEKHDAARPMNCSARSLIALIVTALFAPVAPARQPRDDIEIVTSTSATRLSAGPRTISLALTSSRKAAGRQSTLMSNAIDHTARRRSLSSRRRIAITCRRSTRCRCR